eukprot:jgi/Botrbrau1/10958/Bobra.0383s0012.1
MGQGSKLLLIALYVASTSTCKSQNIFQRIGDFFRGDDQSPSPAPQLPPTAFAPKAAEGATAFEQLVRSDPNDLGPILFKANQAAVLAWNGGDPGSAPNNTNGQYFWNASTRIPLPGNNGALIVWQQNGTVGIALQGSSALQNALDSATSATTTALLPVVSEVVAGAAVPPEALTAISPLLATPTNASSLQFIVNTLSGGQIPSRIVITGYAGGGGLATALAPWIATAYPGSEIRLITFGAPTVGNSGLAFAVNQVVDYVMPWSINGSVLVGGLVVDIDSPQANKNYDVPLARICRRTF